MRVRSIRAGDRSVALSLYRRVTSPVVDTYGADQSDAGRGYMPTGRTNQTRGEGICPRFVLGRALGFDGLELG
eukprot:7498926-Pyramimonas_sp.AAC.1